MICVHRHENFWPDRVDLIIFSGFLQPQKEEELFSRTVLCGKELMPVVRENWD